MGVALRRLRHDRDPTGALESLDEYRDRFPAGTLRAEETAARVEALLAANRWQDALRILEGSPLAPMPGARSLFLLRGELRLKRGDLRAAIVDLDDVLAVEGHDDLAARALYARSSCRSRLADSVAARRDMEEYLDRFPHGPQAAEIRRLLDQ